MDVEKALNKLLKVGHVQVRGKKKKILEVIRRYN